MRALCLLWMAALLAASPAPSQAQSAIEPREFSSEVERKRYRALIGELRCTVCQNEALESSGAPLAADLRDQVYRQIRAGRTDNDIRAYMRERYGDFVLYTPPLAAHTLVLWIGPIALLLVGLATAAVLIRRRRRMLEQAR